MSGYSKVILTGNLTRTPELRYTTSGKPVCDLGLAVNELKDRVSFFDVTCWGKVAETCCQYLQKGAGVLVDGKLVQDRWEQDGVKRQKVKVVAEVVKFRDGKHGPEVVSPTDDPPAEAESPHPTDTGDATETTDTGETDNDDLPF